MPSMKRAPNACRSMRPVLNSPVAESWTHLVWTLGQASISASEILRSVVTGAATCVK